MDDEMSDYSATQQSQDSLEAGESSTHDLHYLMNLDSYECVYCGRKAST